MQHYFLGIDWGKSKVGVALADTETRLAFGITTLVNDADLVDALGRFIDEHAVETVVIGIPSRINREETEYDGERLGKRLTERFGVGIAYQNEMYTTKMARANLVERGVRHLDRHDDREAARLILQQWLDHKRSLSGQPQESY